MKVMVIDDSPRTGYGVDASGRKFTHRYTPPFKYGEVVTASQSERDADMYRLEEYLELDGMDMHWSKDRFIPLSEIDETTFAREFNKQLV